MNGTQTSAADKGQYSPIRLNTEESVVTPQYWASATATSAMMGHRSGKNGSGDPSGDGRPKTRDRASPHNLKQLVMG